MTKFIPPYSNTGSVNSNIRIYSTKTFSQGPGDHGYITESPSGQHVEEENIPFHHDIISSDYYTAQGSGVYEDVIENHYGTPWKSMQGVQILWEQFFEKFTAYESEWNSDSSYYHYLFGKYLSSFVEDFLPHISFIAQNSWSEVTEKYNDGNSDVINEISHLNGCCPNYQFLFTNTSVWENIGNAYMTAINQNIGNPSDGDYEETIMQKWFLGTSDNETKTMYNYDLENGTNIVGKLWGYFLDSTDLNQRSIAPMEWAYSVMIDMLYIITFVTESQAERVTTLTTAQQAATSAMTQINFVPIESASDVSGLTENQRLQGYISVYRGCRQILQSYSQMQATAVDNTNSEVQTDTSMINSLIQTLTSLIQGFFK